MEGSVRKIGYVKVHALNDGFGAVTIGSTEKYITEKAFEMGWNQICLTEPGQESGDCWL